MNFTEKLSAAAEEYDGDSDLAPTFIAGCNKALELLAEKQDGFGPRVWVPIIDDPKSVGKGINKWPAFDRKDYHSSYLGDEYLSLEEHQALRAKDLLRVRELEDCLRSLKHLNNHTIEEEMWRIDAVLEKKNG